MKKAISLFSVIALSMMLALPLLALEEPPEGIPAGPESGEALAGIFENITEWIFYIFLLVTVMFVLMAAFQFLTAGGDPEKVNKARDKILYAAIAVAVALIARGLVPIIKSITGIGE